jgi:creatinine amidohydrolase/Fe(II)-dependent formamide hydrolase-like protein
VDRYKVGLGGAGFALACFFVANTASAQQDTSAEERQHRVAAMLAAPNPLQASDSLWIEDLTYMEVRDRIAAGDTTAIIPTGGIEENGPYLATGKHNVILRALCPAVAAALDTALCAPVVPFVPEGDLDPPSGAMLFPGSVTVRDETYIALLEDIGNSLKLHGFKDVVLIGDSGGNQRGMAVAAEILNRQWQGSGTRAHFVPEFYAPGWEETEKYTAEKLGVSEGENDGYHDDIWVTAMMMVTDPDAVRYIERIAADRASINGVDISDLGNTIDLGRKMIAFRAEYTATAIRKAIGSNQADSN